MLKLLFRSLISLMAGLIFMSVQMAMASGQDATDLIKSTTQQLLAEFDAHRTVYENDKGELYAMVERVAIPHFDFDRMTKLVLGRYSSKATPAEFDAFKIEFKTLLVRTYATALFQYTDQNIDYKPQIDEAKYKIVQASVQLDSVEPVTIEYFLADRDGALKVFDVSIDGISLVTNYHGSYKAIIRSKGLQSLIDSLATKNGQSLQK
jgi:phospholipid transport system substrate-binding protein